MLDFDTSKDTILNPLTPMANIVINQAKINIMSPLTDGRCKLMLSFSYKGNRLRMDTGERCLPEHFDKIKQQVNRKHSLQFETNNFFLPF
jgi:hypothetical protein